MSKRQDVIKARVQKTLARLTGTQPLKIDQPKNTGIYQHRILVGTPTLGHVRIEWHNAMSGLVVPCNWSNGTNTPIGYPVADAQNILAHETLSKGYEWLLLVEDDVIVPPDLFQRFAPYMDKGDVPIVSGLYHLKGPTPTPQPLIYRGRGNGSFTDFKLGSTVWVDGVPTGCLLIHSSILRVLDAQAETYTVRANGQEVPLKRIFVTPRSVMVDQGTGAYQKMIGTSDLYFCDQIIHDGILVKAGWPKIAKRMWPFLVDTSIRCGHIDRNTGAIY